MLREDIKILVSFSWCLTGIASQDSWGFWNSQSNRKFAYKLSTLIFMVMPDIGTWLSCFVNTDCYNGISNLSPPLSGFRIFVVALKKWSSSLTWEMFFVINHRFSFPSAARPPIRGYWGSELVWCRQCWMCCGIMVTSEAQMRRWTSSCCTCR